MMSTASLKMPIGQSDFRRIIEEKYYFVDKSLFIKEVLDDSASVLLITRPRRFGKTLNLSMLHYFFAKEANGEATEGLFEGLKIQQEREIVRQHQGRYPVIFLTFKNTKCNIFENTYQFFCELIAALYGEHYYLLLSDVLTSNEKETYEAILNKQATRSIMNYSLKMLSHYLHRYHKVAPIILIDEYDTPI